MFLSGHSICVRKHITKIPPKIMGQSREKEMRHINLFLGAQHGVWAVIFLSLTEPPLPDPTPTPTQHPKTRQKQDRNWTFFKLCGGTGGGLSGLEGRARRGLNGKKNITKLNPHVRELEEPQFWGLVSEVIQEPVPLKPKIAVCQLFC